MITTLLVAVALAQDPAPKSDTMKNLVKDAIAQPEKPAGPDISKLPFTPDSIKQVVLSYQPQIQGCYEESMANKGSKKVEGSLKTAWVITGEGVVKKAAVKKKESTLKDSKLHDCVVAVLSTMAFPKPPDGKDHPIEFPFNLKAVH
ncbi:MAG: AgmX/PglI C-terminal domain-containing protein [Myxococcales bacterium]|nr:AgmX/PglI C-terminal domain-containing protein [Myxococcales bacterium]